MVKLKSMSFQNKQEQAFTLAEVLITLGIIGVVAALTMPSLINRTRNKELHTAFLKTYSELNQVAQNIMQIMKYQLRKRILIHTVTFHLKL